MFKKELFYKILDIFNIFFITGSLAWYVTLFIDDNHWMGFVSKALITFTIICFSFSLVFYKTKEFKYFYHSV